MTTPRDYDARREAPEGVCAHCGEATDESVNVRGTQTPRHARCHAEMLSDERSPADRAPTPPRVRALAVPGYYRPAKGGA